MVSPLADRDDNLDVPDDPDTVDDSTFADWVDNHADAVKDVLEEMTAVYADDGEKRPVKNASVSHVRPDAEYVGIQFDLPNEVDPEVCGANILRLLDDLNAHEMSHKNWSDLNAKQNIAESYPNSGRLAGYVMNIVEDEYIDARRGERWEGLKEKQAYYVWLHMNTESRAPPVNETYEDEGIEDAVMNALLQTALAGYANGIDDAPPEIAECMARVDPLFDKVREMGVRDERTNTDGRERSDERAVITHTILNILLRYLPDPDEVDEDKLETRSRDTSAQSDPERSPDTGGETEMDLSDEMKEQIAEMISEMMDDGEMPDPNIEPASDGEGMKIELDADEMGEKLDSPDEPEPPSDATDETEAVPDDSGIDVSETDDRESETSDSDAEAGGSDGKSEEPGSPDANPGGSEAETGFDEGDIESDSGSPDDDSETRDVEAVVDEYGAENLIIDS